MKEFNKLINERLKELNMSKYKLSKLTGIFEQTIYSILKGESKNPRLDHVIKIATVLDIDLNKLKGENQWLNTYKNEHLTWCIGHLQLFSFVH